MTQPKPKRIGLEPCSRYCILVPPGRQPGLHCKLGWRKGQNWQEGRHLHPFPQKHVLHRPETMSHWAHCLHCDCNRSRGRGWEGGVLEAWPSRL